MDMSGKLLHTWFAPGKYLFDHAELLPDGDVLGIDQEGSVLYKLGWRSHIKWMRTIPAHHDLAVGLDNEIYILTDGGVRLPQFHQEKLTVENWIEVLQPNGRPVRKIAISKLLLGSGIPLEQMPALIKKNIDPGVHDAFHANTLEFIERDVPGPDGKLLFRRGQLLTCIRNLNLIAVVDLRRERIVWYWGMDQLERPHQPSLLPNGHILVFDNGSHRMYSRVVQMDPANKEIVWQNRAGPSGEFFSNTSGGETTYAGRDYRVSFRLTPIRDRVLSAAAKLIQQRLRRGQPGHQVVVGPGAQRQHGRGGGPRYLLQVEARLAQAAKISQL